MKLRLKRVKVGVNSISGRTLWDTVLGILDGGFCSAHNSHSCFFSRGRRFELLTFGLAATLALD